LWYVLGSPNSLKGNQVKNLLIILSILLLSSPVIGDNHKGETLYRWGNTLPYVWKGFGDKETHPVYKGDVENGFPNGQGTLTSPDGIKYIGEFKDGKPHGQGTTIFPDGEKYFGEYKDGFPNGQGTITYPDGGKYVGEFKDGKPHGQGTYTFTSGSKYTGELKDGLWNGQGTFTFPNGNKGIGEFSENKPLNITEYDKDGNIIGKYVNGNRIKQ